MGKRYKKLNNVRKWLDTEKTWFCIAGFAQCPSYQRALEAGRQIEAEKPDKYQIRVTEFVDRFAFLGNLNGLRGKVKHTSAEIHNHSPFIWRTELLEPRFIGGYEEFIAYIEQLKAEEE